jgi:hypothetical protein
MITLLLACFASLYAATLDQPPSAAKNSVSEIMRRPASARLKGASAGESG